MYESLKSTWLEPFEKYMETRQGCFRPLKETLYISSGWAAREEAGLGSPPSEFTTSPMEAVHKVVKKNTGNIMVDHIKFTATLENYSTTKSVT